MRQMQAWTLTTAAVLNVFVLLSGFVTVDVLRSQPPMADAYPATLAKDTPDAAQSDAAPVDPNQLADKLDDPMSDIGLGEGLTGYVADAASGETLFDKNASEGVTPASTTKLVTAVSALSSLDPDEHLHTKVVRSGDTLTLVGGGDPTLSSTTPGGYPSLASMAELAQRTADSLDGSETGTLTLTYDDSLYTGPPLAPSWKPNYVTGGSVAPVHALMVDEGYGDDGLPVDNPPRQAAEEFVQQLEDAGVDVSGAPSSAEAPEDAERVARVASPEISALVEKMLLESNNNIAEALVRHVARSEGESPSFGGGSTAISGVMSDLGISGVDVADGSGLSADNSISPEALVDVLTTALDSENPELQTVPNSLPTAHFTGTLDGRYAPDSPTEDGAGVVRAKTGTLSEVSALAGTINDADGRLLLFAFIANDPLASGGRLDRLASAVATCGCS